MEIGREFQVKRAAWRLELGRKRRARKQSVAAQDHRPLDHVFQFAHVAGEIAGEQKVSEFRTHFQSRLVIALSVLLGKMVDEQRNVSPALAQGRESQVNN